MPNDGDIRETVTPLPSHTVCGRTITPGMVVGDRKTRMRVETIEEVRTQEWDAATDEWVEDTHVEFRGRQVVACTVTRQLRPTARKSQVCMVEGAICTIITPVAAKKRR